MLFLTTAFACGFPVGAKISNTNIAIKTEAIRAKRNIQVRKQQRSLFHSGIHFFLTGIFFSRRRHVGIKRGHLAMLTLDQLPFQAEGYRHIVCLIDNYASSENVLTKKCGWESDSGIALKQTCRAVHAWYHWTAEESGLVLHETSSEDEE